MNDKLIFPLKNILKEEHFLRQSHNVLTSESQLDRLSINRNQGRIWAAFRQHIWVGFRQHWAVLRQHLGRVWAALRQQRAGFGQHLGSIGQYLGRISCSRL